VLDLECAYKIIILDSEDWFLTKTLTIFIAYVKDLAIFAALKKLSTPNLG